MTMDAVKKIAHEVGGRHLVILELTVGSGRRCVVFIPQAERLRWARRAGRKARTRRSLDSHGGVQDRRAAKESARRKSRGRWRSGQAAVPSACKWGKLAKISLVCTAVTSWGGHEGAQAEMATQEFLQRRIY